MDANTIRLILIVVGALLILLLYLWERYREKRDEDEYGYEEENETGDAYDEPYGVRTQKREPNLGAYEDEDEHDAPARPAPAPAARLDVSDRDQDPDREDTPLADSEPVAADARPETIDPLLIQLSVSGRKYPFRGPALLEETEKCGLHPGEMDIFHCLDEFDDETRIYFSMANMVKPGTFPFDAMDDFSTPGLMLFAQLEGDPEDMTTLDEMIATARKLAQALDADVLDDARRPLTVRKEEEMRQAVLAHEMRWARAMLR